MSHPAPQPITWRFATVVDVLSETPRVRTLVLDVPGWRGHRAGQHVDVRLTAEDGYQAQRSYSIASAPEDVPVAAGILSEIFAVDLTVARAMCAHCGATRAVGALLVYAHGMGTVVRCPSCDAVIMRVGRTPTQIWLDSTGARHLIIAGARPAGMSG